jgi:glucose-6-phosphate isomerase
MYEIQYHQNYSTHINYFSPQFYEYHWNAFLQTLKRPDIGFFRLEDFPQHVQACQKVYTKFKHKKSFVHIGLGGSSLGPEAFVSALNPSKMPFIFLNNIDGDYLREQLESVNLRESLFYIVSKSGNTPETLAIFSWLTQYLKDQIGDFQLSDYFVFATEENQGTLRQLAEQYSLSTLPIPKNIGGRFSVLTPVGLFPALFAGWDIDQLPGYLEEYQKQITQSAHWSRNSLMQMGLSIIEMYEDSGIDQTVLMPYSSKLKNISLWFVQLWAESLGKIKADQKSVGLTPLYAVGSTDQHSQMQLFMEGPINKFILFLSVKDQDQQYPLANSFEHEKLKTLNKYSMHQLLTAQLNGTMQALEQRNRPFAHIQLPEINEVELSKIVFFLECLTVFTGQLIQVNPFDQPGVELGKELSMKFLKQST